MFKKKNESSKGFTLIEILVAIIMISILCSVAAASYRSYIVKSRRQAVTDYLMNLQQQVEDFYLINHTYTGACSANSKIDCTGSGDVSSHYTITYANQSASDRDMYTLSATAKGAQANSDSECKYIYLKRNGERGGGTESGKTSKNACW